MERRRIYSPFLILLFFLPCSLGVFFLPSLVLLLAMSAEQDGVEEGNVQSEEEEMN